MEKQKEGFWPETADDKFLKNMKKKYETKKVDEPKLDKQTMVGILKDITQVPDKLHMTNAPEKISVKPQKAGENQLHTGFGKDMFKSTMKLED